MKIAFLGLKQSFDYFQIGGVESYVRRLARYCLAKDSQVEYILYGGATQRVLLQEGISLRYFIHFKNALQWLKHETYDHVVSLYLRPKDRLAYAWFRKAYSDKSRYHFILFSWPDSYIKRLLYFAEPYLFPFTGNLYCISKRQFIHVSRWNPKTIHLLPPVSEFFFIKPEQKPTHKRIHVTFLGRIDPGKGLRDVIGMFEELQKDDRYKLTVYGIHYENDSGSVAIHKYLKAQNNIQYIEVDRMKYTPQLERHVADSLRETDVFIQPYQKLSSTIDTPLLILEAMASLCTVITKPLGNIPDIYGNRMYMIPHNNFVSEAIHLLKEIDIDTLVHERRRLVLHNSKLAFNLEAIGNKFLTSI